MISRRSLLLTASATALATGFLATRRTPTAHGEETFKVAYTDEEWRKRLDPQQYVVLRKAGTEYPGSSPLLHEKRRGTFACAGCDLDLFSSTTKYDSRTGWPSFWAPLEHAVGTERDTTLGMIRTSVHCAQCGGHLGHVFNDGPPPTGLRYCMNGVAMTFKPTMA
jgi:peptide-methionine (R)-S-oxide reductase